MKKAIFVLGLVLLASLSLAVTVVENKNITVINFDRYPVFNVTVKYVTQSNLLQTRYNAYIIKPYIIPGENVKILSISYDNSTWLEVVGKELDEKTGKLVLTGKTEDASVCMEGKKTGRDLDFWNDPNHCYTRITAWVNEKQVGEAFADEKGNWKLEIPLSPGENNIKLEARDPGGNTAEKTLAVEWSPPAQGLLSYYLSKPEVQLGIAVAVLVVLISLGLIIKGERERARREKEIKQKLAQLFEDEAVLVKKLGWQARESLEYQALVRKILMSEPFATKLEKDKKIYQKLKDNPEKLKAWLESFDKSIEEMVKKFNPNVHAWGSNAYIFISVYKYIAREQLKH